MLEVQPRSRLLNLLWTILCPTSLVYCRPRLDFSLYRPCRSLTGNCFGATVPFPAYVGTVRRLTPLHDIRQSVSAWPLPSGFLFRILGSRTGRVPRCTTTSASPSSSTPSPFLQPFTNSPPPVVSTLTSSLPKAPTPSMAPSPTTVYAACLKQKIIAPPAWSFPSSASCSTAARAK